MVEMHPHPESALCDGKQSLRPDRFMALMGSIGPIVQEQIIGRLMGGRDPLQAVRLSNLLGLSISVFFVIFMAFIAWQVVRLRKRRG